MAMLPVCATEGSGGGGARYGGGGAGRGGALQRRLGQNTTDHGASSDTAGPLLQVRL